MQTAYKTYDDRHLLALLASEDETAFAEIYQRYSALLFTYAFNILKQSAAAEDAVQEIFLSLWKRRESLTHIDSLGGYLTQSIRYFVLRALKEEKRDTGLYARLSAITDDIQASDPSLYTEIQQVINSIINSLPQDQQYIYRLNKEQGYTYKEIADALNISVKTVEKKMSKTLQQLKLGINQALLVLAILKDM